MTKTFAEDLKAVREEKNLSLKTIAQQTRLNLTALENIENGDFGFQPQAYIRAFLKQYINSLGLDVEETLFDYDLARSGKYKSKRQNIPAPPAEQVILNQEPEESTEVKSALPEKEEFVTEEPAKITEEKKPGSERPVPVIPREREFTEEKKFGNKLRLRAPENKKDDYAKGGPAKKNILSSLTESPVVRNIFLIIFICLVLLGIYSLINILFFDGSKDKPEVIRQNFDDVVKEQEKKILGKRTPQEIQDSIKRAEEEFAASADSIVLKITALNDGVLYLVTDSANYNKPDKIEFQKKNVSVHKAKNRFYISSSNTETFRVTVNDKPVKFDKPSVSKALITKAGLSK